MSLLRIMQVYSSTFSEPDQLIEIVSPTIGVVLFITIVGLLGALSYTLTETLWLEAEPALFTAVTRALNVPLPEGVQTTEDEKEPDEKTEVPLLSFTSSV